jgi:hypothetical protein
MRSQTVAFSVFLSSSQFNVFWMPDQVRHDDLGTFCERIKTGVFAKSPSKLLGPKDCTKKIGNQNQADDDANDVIHGSEALTSSGIQNA